jgi:hypothetical protein
VTKYVNTAANITTNPAMKEATLKEIAAANNKGAAARVDPKKLTQPLTSLVKGPGGVIG